MPTLLKKPANRVADPADLCIGHNLPKHLYDPTSLTERGPGGSLTGPCSMGSARCDPGGGTHSYG